MRLYHGTRSCEPSALQREGLRPGDPEAVLPVVLRAFGYERLEDVRPKWVQRQLVAEVEHRRAQGAVVHTTLSKSNAAGYASWIDEGGEHVTLLEDLLWRFARRRKGKMSLTGIAYVCVLEVPWEAVPQMVRESLIKIWQHGYGRDLGEGAWDIQLETVPPEWVVTVQEGQTREEGQK